MKFGIHNGFNNNAAGLGRFLHPDGYHLMSSLPVRLTDKGFAIISLDDTLPTEQKVALVGALDLNLMADFGTGLSFVTSGASDCMGADGVLSVFAAAKTLSPSITTIFAASKGKNNWIGCPNGLIVDHIVDRWARNPDTAEVITQILQPSENDKTPPQNGWTALQEKIEKILANAIRKVQP